MADDPTDFTARQEEHARRVHLERELMSQSGKSLSQVRRSLRSQQPDRFAQLAAADAVPQPREPQRLPTPAIQVTQVDLPKKQIVEIQSDLTAGNAGTNGADGGSAVDPDEIEPHNLGAPPATADTGATVTSGEVLVEDADPDTEPGINAKTLYALATDLLVITDFNDERLLKVGRTVLPEDGTFLITGTRSSETDVWTYQKVEQSVTNICVHDGDTVSVQQVIIFTVPIPPP